MGIKDLFENPKGTKILSSEDFDRDVRKVESVENIEAKFYEKRRFMPNFWKSSLSYKCSPPTGFI